MSFSPVTFIENRLCAWNRLIIRFPVLVLLCCTILAGISMLYTMHNLGLNTNTAEMLSPDLPFQINRKRLEQEFPQDSGVLIFVVEAPTPEETTQLAVKLKQQLLTLPEHFQSAYIPADNHFFRQQALLFLDLNELDELAEKLSSAQPFIGYLAENFHLKGLFDIISMALLQQNSHSQTMNLQPVLQALNDQAEQQLAGKTGKLSWQHLLVSTSQHIESKRRIVLTRPLMNFNEILPAGLAMSAARNAIQQLEAEYPGATIRITGEPALEHEEMESVTEGSIFAGIASLVLVCLSLFTGLRSFRLLIATFIALILGLVLTAGFATLSIGHLNLISIAFAVLYIGLGVDFAIHFCLQYRESLQLDLDNEGALQHSVKTIGVSLFLCALTTSLGFLAFIPTDYSGVSEFGVISGGGMFIGLFVTLTFLPAFLKLFPLRDKAKTTPLHCFFPEALVAFPSHQAWAIRLWSFILALIALLIVPKAMFDSNPINLRNPDCESVETIRELLQSHHDSPFALAALADNLPEAINKAEKIAALDSVHQAITLQDLVTDQQDEKLAVIDDLDFILGHRLSSYPGKIKQGHAQQAIADFSRNMEFYLKTRPNATNKTILQSLLDNLDLLSTQSNAGDNITQFEERVLSLLPSTLEQLKTSFTAQPYNIDDIPAEVASQWIGKSGVYKILISPSQDQNLPQNLKQFVNDVQEIDPAATGLPVADLASGDAVVLAFVEAFSGAIIAIFLLLLLILKSLKNTLLVLGPLLLASLLTGASTVLTETPINFANIIALPLLMGMGVDSGIHILHRLHDGHSTAADVLRSNTARGVFFSSLTTFCSFTSLAFVPHQGTASMGVLLAIGISITLICTLLVLPAFYNHRHSI